MTNAAARPDTEIADKQQTWLPDHPHSASLISLIPLALAILVVAVYWPAARFGFVAWDDGKNIYENPHLGLAWQNLKWMFTDSEYAHRYLPFGWLSYSVDRALFGGGPQSYHIGNILLHALDTSLLFLVLIRLFGLFNKDGSRGTAGAQLAASIGALVWAINPLRVEAVAWASARIYNVASAFVLLAILSYLRAAANPAAMKRNWLFLAALLYGAAIFTYPIALGSIVFFLMLDVYPLKRLPLKLSDWKTPTAIRCLGEKALFLIPAALMLALTVWSRAGNPNLGAIIDAEQPGVVERSMQALYVWCYYLWKPWAPFNLAPEYPTLLEITASAPRFLLSAIIVLGLTWLVWMRRKTRPAWLALWVCHLALLVPVLGIESLGHYHSNDRYSYFQGLVWAALIAGCIKLAWSSVRWRKFAFAAAAIWICFCIALVQDQIAIWKGSLALHTRIVASLARNPDVYTGQRVLRDRAMHETFLGQLQQQAGNATAAESSFRHAITLHSATVDARYYLARLLAQQKRTDEARATTEELLRLNPSDVDGRLLLAVILGETGDFAGSAQHLKQVLLAKPGNADAHHNLAVTLERLGNTNEARAHYARAAELRMAQAR